MILLAIPAQYPIIIAIVKTRLFPLADLDLMLLITEIGQEIPKQISIITSKICAILLGETLRRSPFLFFIPIIRLTNDNVKYIFIIETITFGYRFFGGIMEFIRLKYFYEVAKCEHVTKAAENLHIAQPALTKSIKILEDELGVSLFYKSGRRIKLTKYGEFLKGKVEPLLREVELLPQTVEKMTDMEKNTVTLNVLAASTIITDIIIKFKKKYPDVIFRMTRKEDDTDAEINVLTNATDFSEGFGEKKKAVIEERIFVAVPKTSPFADRDEVDLSEFKHSQFILLSGKRRFRLLCDYYCEIAGFSPQVVFESDSLIAVKNLIRAGEGVAFWPHFSWGKAGSNIKFLKIKNPDCHREIVLLLGSGHRNVSPVSEKFFEFLVKELSASASKL